MVLIWFSSINVWPYSGGEKTWPEDLVFLHEHPVYTRKGMAECMWLTVLREEFVSETALWLECTQRICLVSWSDRIPGVMLHGFAKGVKRTCICSSKYLCFMIFFSQSFHCYHYYTPVILEIPVMSVQQNDALTSMHFFHYAYTVVNQSPSITKSIMLT